MKYQKIHQEINFSEIAENIIIWPLQSKEKTKFDISAKEKLKNIDFWRSCDYFSICRWWRHHVDWLAVRAPEMMSSPQNHLEHSNILLEIILTNQITCGCTKTYYFDWKLIIGFQQVDWIYRGADAVNFDWNYLEFQVSDLRATGLKRTVLGLFEHS